MASQVFAFWVSALVGVWNFFTQLLGASGMRGIYLAMFSALVAYRLLIVPIIGNSTNAGSDKVKRKK